MIEQVSGSIHEPPTVPDITPDLPVVVARDVEFLLAVLVDLAPYDQTPPQEQLDVLLRELGAYQPDLLDRPRVVLASKADVAQQDIPDGALVISSVTGEGLDRAVGAMAELVRESRSEEPETSAITIHRPAPEGIAIERGDDGSFIVVGRAAERAVALNDLTNEEAQEYVQQRLTKLGVDKALAKAGAREGDVVVVGNLVFDYSEEVG